MSFNTNMENPGYNHTINNESIQKSDTIVYLGSLITETIGKQHLHKSKKIWKNPGAQMEVIFLAHMSE
jgi:hypothetical protein